MASTNSSSAGKSDASGQSVRCTERAPVRPRQISSVVNGSSGAVTRVTTSRVVYRVSKALSRDSLAVLDVSQNRSRERRMYQLDSTSRKWRTDSHAEATS